MLESSKEYTGAELEYIAQLNNMSVETVVPHVYQEVEYKVLSPNNNPFISYFFLMNNETFDYSYSHTYDAKKDITSKKMPKIFAKV